MSSTISGQLTPTLASLFYKAAKPDSHLKLFSTFNFFNFYHVSDQFSKNHVKILLGDFNSKGQKIFSKDRLHDVSNDNGTKAINFATSKYLTANSTKIRTYAWTSPEGNTQSD
jgi:hypothetical protein